MKELETLVDGFKTDQREIETVIVRTLHNLDELEETAAPSRKPEHGGRREPAPDDVQDGRPSRRPQTEEPSADLPAAQDPSMDQEPQPAKEELDIF